MLSFNIQEKKNYALTHACLKNHDIVLIFNFLQRYSFSGKTSNIASLLHSALHLMKFLHIIYDLSFIMVCQGKQAAAIIHIVVKETKFKSWGFLKVT